MEPQGRTDSLLPLKPQGGDRLTEGVTDRRYDVYSALLAGEPSKVIARRLGLSRQAVHRHAAALFSSGALRRLSPPRSPLVVERGPRSGAYERAVTVSTGGGLSVRAHHWRWVWSFRGEPAYLRGERPGFRWGHSVPVWSDSAEASGVPSFWMSVDVDGEPWVVREYRGRVKRSLEFSPAPQWCFDAEQVAGAERVMGRRVGQFAREFARRFGYDLVGELRKNHRTEWALPAPAGVSPVGVPGSDAAWADESEGAGRVEIETGNRSTAAAWVDLPRWQIEQEARLVALEGRVGRLLGVSEQIVGKMESEEK